MPTLASSGTLRGRGYNGQSDRGKSVAARRTATIFNAQSRRQLHRHPLSTTCRTAQACVHRPGGTAGAEYARGRPTTFWQPAARERCLQALDPAARWSEAGWNAAVFARHERRHHIISTAEHQFRFFPNAGKNPGKALIGTPSARNFRRDYSFIDATFESALTLNVPKHSAVAMRFSFTGKGCRASETAETALDDLRSCSVGTNVMYFILSTRGDEITTGHGKNSRYTW